MATLGAHSEQSGGNQIRSASKAQLQRVREGQRPLAPDPAESVREFPELAPVVRWRSVRPSAQGSAGVERPLCLEGSPPCTRPLSRYDSGHLDVGDGHAVYWEVVGSPDGLPAIWLHGGPGAPASPNSRRNFDPARYRAVIFDQRGCGRSRPLASDADADLSTNTTDHLVADIERLRSHLGIDRWVVVGGSWGVTLALVYAQRHPERVLGMVLAAVTSGRWRETQWITRDMGRVFPRQWDRFVELISQAERGGDLAAAYARLLPARIRRCVRRLPGAGASGRTPTCPWRPAYEPHLIVRELSWQMIFARLVTHYWGHGCFLADRPGAPVHGEDRANPRHADSRPPRRLRPARHCVGDAQGMASEPPGRRRRRRSFRRKHGRGSSPPRSTPWPTNCTPHRAQRTRRPSALPSSRRCAPRAVPDPQRCR